ncbi:MAG TPA: TIGR00730 family Rossman fold protein [Vicinamibacteria bacterium]|jgi:uncharacterized protein (TIGR00730 family)|nr:TIGR00730 family Rossman fold protein [Vicinamibacteria bacterium]
MRVCVFCGSSGGARPDYAAAATEVGRLLVERGHGIVYGGGSQGLMGCLVAAVHQAGGEIVGVIPEDLMRREIASPFVTELRVVPTMHARKALMHDLASAFLVLPGGLGTLEELFETLTWAQLGLHRKPIGLLDVAGYFQPLLALFEQAIAEGFIAEKQRGLFKVSQDPRGMLELLSLS